MAERWTFSNKSIAGVSGNKDRVGYSLKKQRVVSQSRRIDRRGKGHPRKQMLAHVHKKKATV